MKNFKEIAEKCLAGELSGTFVLRNGDEIRSVYIIKKSNFVCSYWNQLYGFFSDNGNCCSGNKHYPEYDIINFISDNMQEQIKIDIPEGKVPVMEQTENGITITWANKDITYKQVFDYLNENHQLIQYQANMMVNKTDSNFLRKVNVIGKLTNIRNYFGKPDNMLEGWCIAYSKHYNTFTANYINDADMWFSGVIFKEGEHAEQAIKMLGDELKYLFEPW